MFARIHRWRSKIVSKVSTDASDFLNRPDCTVLKEKQDLKEQI